ncbi:MAG: phage baseplate assembly protein V [Thiocapsa sp.]|jgi:uncharacterized protein involved in type VI secretion and phage assembly|nr:phage baseplate assembly protein V [Thiocapsa sp.]MCG6986327.1 phage baseplate assembly protein V [Thiocapsa sp.]
MSNMARMMAGTGEAERAADGFPRGLAFGRVTDNQDPDGLGRVRVKLELHSNDQASFWARIATPMAGPEIGAWFLPEIDDEVLVGFIGEDASHPVVLGSVWNSRRPPPETNSDGNNDRRLIRSRSNHELRFDDGTANEIELTMEDGSRVYLAEGQAVLEDRQGNKVEIKDGNVTVEATQKLTLKGTNVVLQATSQLEIKAGTTCKIQGTMVEIN